MYDIIAHYYDLTHANLTADIDYLLTFTETVSGPILELGCGSGRILLPLARAGHTLTGVDNSPVMLARARARLSAEPEAIRRRVTLAETDMTQMKLDTAVFQLAIFPYNTMMHLNTGQLAQTLRRIHDHLAKNGRLLIDITNPAAITHAIPNDLTLTLEKTFTDPENGRTVLQFASTRLYEKTQKFHITWLYDASPPEGGPVHRTVAAFDYYYYYPHQLELLLRDAGFTLRSIFGSYDESPFREDSPRLLLHAKKA